jgi:hypothetical protein
MIKKFEKNNYPGIYVVISGKPVEKGPKTRGNPESSPGFPDIVDKKTQFLGKNEAKTN